MTSILLTERNGFSVADDAAMAAIAADDYWRDHQFLDRPCMTFRPGFASPDPNMRYRFGEAFRGRRTAGAARASPSAPQPLVVLGDLSALRVRVELDERDVGAIRTGQPVVVRSAAFPGRDFAGKVSSVAPIIGPGSFGARGQSSFTDIDVAEVVVELAAPGPLVVGMKVDAYFHRNDL